MPAHGEAREQLRTAVAQRAHELDPTADAFVDAFSAQGALEDVELADAENVAQAAVAHWHLGARRKAGTALVRVHTPTAAASGWDAPHTVVDVVNDDMPFLVDSITMAIDRHDLGVHVVVHPVFAARRDADGNLLSLAAPGADPAETILESWVHVEVDRETSTDVLDAVRDEIEHALRDVRSATDDWKPMRGALESVISELDAQPPPVDTAELTEGRALLRWMADDHFTFLGYRRYDLVPDAAGDDTLCAVPISGLGILRGAAPAPGPGEPSASFSRLPAAVRAKARERTLLVLTKANTRSTVHRPSYLDYVGVKRYDAAGNVIGEHRFLGLYTSSAYTASPTDVPVLRRKVAEVMARAGFAFAGHDFKDLFAILENYPRDDLFQIEPDALLEIALGILALQERRRVRMFVHREQYGRFVSCLVYLPRDRYNTPVRVRIADLLLDEFGATSYEWNTYLSASVLARLHFVLRVDPLVTPNIDLAALEARVAAAARAWTDDLRDALISVCGEEEGLDLFRVWSNAFPASYQENNPAAEAVADLTELRALDAPSAPTLSVRVDGDTEHLDLELYGLGAQPSLSDVMPRLTNMGVTVDDERPHTITPANLPARWIKQFRLRIPAGAAPGSFDRFEAAFLAVSNGDAEDDTFNQLVLLAGLSWREAALLRAYSRYLQQIGTPFSQAYIASTLAAHPDIARRLITLFTARFDPQHTTPPDIDPLVQQITSDLDGVASLDEDRILRALLHVVLATLRTNWFQSGDGGARRPCVALKLDPALVPDLPLPRPMFELWVYAPRVEGVHLRAGRVARGGIRWSDRREDFRTEILGLMKAQKVKNAVIVPSGAKGGFVVKQPPADPTALRAEVEACYRLFIAALLDVTDNRVTTADGESVVEPPARVVRFDADDPYLVVAADKGTASFSDIANEVACARGFWLGDAFASGGSAGYDHKEMGITARGAWESVRRHFRHLAIDPDRDDFTVVGIGDMSGDVFGNGMLLSHHIRLVAAFDHRHVFLDPHPDAERSWQERKRLFDLPRSSWADYDASLISAGGGVYPRAAKAVPITDEVREALGIEPSVTSCTPGELIGAILRAPVDLLYNGGIGTYVKARVERNADVGDKTNDALRVDGADLRCHAVGEGGNLGLTQLARVEYALHGGLVNTDAIDNSAGVDTSDHEVNIKILLDTLVRSGDLDASERTPLLESMTDEIAALVLRDNYRQNRALDAAKAQASEMEDVHARFMRSLEQQKHLDRTVEMLPDDETLANRRNAGLGLTVPELAVLLAYAKITLEEDLLTGPVPDDADFLVRARPLLPHGRARALRRQAPAPSAPARARRHRAGQRARQPSRHHLRVPHRGGDRRVVRRHRAGARSCARDRRPAGALERHRGTRPDRRRRRADRDVPRVTEAGRADLPLAPAPPPATAAGRDHDRAVRRRVQPAGGRDARVRPRRDPRPARCRRARAHRHEGSGRARGPDRRAAPPAGRARSHGARRGPYRRRRARGRAVRRDRRPAPARLAPRPGHRAAARRSVGRARPECAARRRRGGAPRGRRRGAGRLRHDIRRGDRVRLVGRYSGVAGRAHARDHRRHLDAGRVRSRDALGRAARRARHFSDCADAAVSRGRPRRPWSSPCRRPRTCSRGRCRHRDGAARTSS